jgi:predicted ribosomally synthesized peptide with SipW-like signal peptide
MNKKILASIFVIGILALAMGWGTYSWFSDIETSTGNTFAAGTIDLAVDPGTGYYENPLHSVIVNLADMKPSMWRDVTAKIKNVGNNEGSAWFHIHITEFGNLKPSEPGNPDINNIQDWITFDLRVDGVIIIHPDDHIKLGDIHSIWIPLGGLAVAQEKSITMSFHLQDETPNYYQGDYVKFNIDFFLNQLGAPDPTSNRILLENKGPDWKPIIGDGIWGVAEYHTSTLTLTVEAHGLKPTFDYQISINSPEVAAWYPVDLSTRVKMASALASGTYTDPAGTAPPSGFNLYERGYWGTGQTYLEAGYTDGDIGVWAWTKSGSHGSPTTDSGGYFMFSTTATLPAGDYSYIKLVVKEDVSPWTPVLMECWIPMFFTIP